jgi:hypothetical protein
MPVHTEKERAKRKVKRSNQAAVSDATKVAVKSERNKKVRPEIRQAPVKGSDVLKGMAKHVFGPIEQGFMVAAGGGPLSSGTKALLKQITKHIKSPVSGITTVLTGLSKKSKDFDDALAVVQKLVKKNLPLEKGLSASDRTEVRNAVSSGLQALRKAKKRASSISKSDKFKSSEQAKRANQVKVNEEKSRQGKGPKELTEMVGENTKFKKFFEGTGRGVKSLKSTSDPSWTWWRSN